MEISEIKQRLTLSRVLNYYGLKPDKNLRLHCPFHEDKTPSLQVYYKTHTAYCFSSNCKTHGKSLDVIDFVMHKENSTKAAAIKKAIELLGGDKDTPVSNRNPTLAKPSMSKEQILQNMFQYFKNAVHNSRPAQEYIKQRGLDATKLEIGYNTAQFHHGTRKDEQLINDCVQYGLLIDAGLTSKTGDKAYKVFGKGCIVFALRNKANQVTGLYFRSTVNEENAPESASLSGSSPTARHFYLKDRKGIYPDYPKSETKSLIITESIIDAATLLQIKSIHSNYSIISAYGTNGLNDEMKTAISELKQLQEIIFAFDHDEAGNTAVEKYSKQLKQQLPNIIFAKLELPCKDVNETLVAHQPEIIEHLLATRTNIFLSNEKKKEVESIVKLIVTETNKLNTSNPYKLIFTTDTATYFIKGGVDKVMNKLTVTIEIENQKSQNNINKRRFKIDLYDNKQIEKLVQEASELLQLTKSNLEKDIHELTEQLDHYREKEMQSTTTEEQAEPSVYLLTPQEKNEALQLARDKNLIKTITEKLTQTGIIGEDENKTFLFVVGASHIQENPLNALIQGSSGSGKTNLLKGIFKIMPEESKKIYSRCSEKMLYNVPKYYFKNKLICFEDVDGLGEEAEYAWRELVSNGELISGVSYKDEKGNIGIKELVVYGPITSIACTTKGAIYADNMSRLFLIAIDESKEQTQKINEYQAKEASGQINKAEQLQAIKQLQNYIRILAPYQVHNPHATKLKLPENIRDERRLYRLYLYFIDMITVLHQYQRKKTEQGKLIATKQDCQIAKDLMFACIMLKMDELDGSLRQFFERLKDYIKTKNNDKYSFTQREIRTALNVSKTHLFRFITELKQMEYLQENQYNGNQGNTYQIRYWDDYKKVKEEVKEFMQNQIKPLAD